MRNWLLLLGFFLLFSSPSTTAFCQNIKEKDLPLVTKNDEPLKAFQTSNRVVAEQAGRFVEYLLIGVVGAMVIAFLLIAFFYEQSEASKPSLNTKPIRAPGISRYRRESEEKTNRYEINDDE